MSKITDNSYNNSYTLDYALWRIIENHGIINCPFGSLQDYAIQKLSNDGYQLEIIKDKKYRGTLYKAIKNDS